MNPGPGTERTPWASLVLDVQPRFSHPISRTQQCTRNRGDRFPHCYTDALAAESRTSASSCHFGDCPVLYPLAGSEVPHCEVSRRRPPPPASNTGQLPPGSVQAWPLLARRGPYPHRAVGAPGWRGNPQRWALPPGSGWSQSQHPCMRGARRHGPVH